MSFYEIPGEQFCKENIAGDGKTIEALPNLGMEIPLFLKDIVMYLLHGHFRDLVRFGQIFPWLRGLATGYFSRISVYQVVDLSHPNILGI